MPNLLEKVKCWLDGEADQLTNVGGSTIDGCLYIRTPSHCVEVNFIADFDSEFSAGETCYGTVVWGASHEITDITNLQINVGCVFDTEDNDVDYTPSSDELSAFRELITDYLYENVELECPNVYVRADGCY